jgi:anthraniloyl-CoA monooxygenase
VQGARRTLVFARGVGFNEARARCNGVSMRIVCVGGGPAGTYFALLAKLRDKGNDVTVVERNPAGVTHGWGVVYWEDLLDNLYRNDPVSARQIRRSSRRWQDQVIHLDGGRPAYLGGSGFSMGRKRLLEILAGRAADVGVDVQFEREVRDLAEFAGADLVVACDGVNSRIRNLYPDRFRTDVEIGRNKYVWLGTDRLFDTFTFAFEKTAAGWVWFHAYRFDDATSTCIIECAPETWRGLGLDTLGRDESIRLLEGVFAKQLRGCSLLEKNRAERLPWLNFQRVANENWYHGNVVLMGDAAHTTHFTIGSGTKLAIDDAVALADVLHGGADLPAALETYQRARIAGLAPLRRDEVNSARWFEDIDAHLDQPAPQFAYDLQHRRGTPQQSPRYLVHLATQRAALRRLRRWRSSARSLMRARRRERFAAAGAS